MDGVAELKYHKSSVYFNVRVYGNALRTARRTTHPLGTYPGRYLTLGSQLRPSGVRHLGG